MTSKHSSAEAIKCNFPKGSCQRKRITANSRVVFRTQNHQPIPAPGKEAEQEEKENLIDFNHRFLSCKYDGILLRHDLDPRILRTRELLKAFPRTLPNLEDPEKKAEAILMKGKLQFVFDTFERLETARRTEASRLLEEKQHFKRVKQRFLQTRTDLLNQIPATVNAVTSRYSQEFKDLEKHRHFLDKEIANINPKIGKAQRINGDLLAKISYVQNYGPMIAEKLAMEEAELEDMRSKKSSLEGRIIELETAIEDVLQKQDLTRLDIQSRRASLMARVEDKLILLEMHRDEREDRKNNPLVHHSVKDFLQAQHDELARKVGEFRRVVRDLNDLMAANKVSTDVTLAKIKAEHTRQEELRKEAELRGKPILTKEQIKEKLRQQKARRERKERERREKELRKKQALERNFARMRAQMKEANDHLRELQQERLILDPQLERMGLLEETFQADYDEKAVLKADLTAEIEQKTEEVEERTQKLAELEADFKIKIGAQRVEMEKARRQRRQQEKLLKDFKKHDVKERKRIASELAKLRAELEEATNSCQNSLALYKRAVHRNQEVKAELAEIHLAIRIAKDLLPGDESRRKAKEDELNRRTAEVTASFRKRYQKLVDKAHTCVEFAEWKETMRHNFTRDLADLRQFVLVDLQGLKMQFDMEFSKYRMLMFHKRRFDSMRDYMVAYGQEQRVIEQKRDKNMYDYAVEKRRELAEAVHENFRVVRKYYHLNVVYHVLHVESVREFFRNHAAEDGYKSAMELLSTEKVFKSAIQHELSQRQNYWSARLNGLARNLNQHMSILTENHEEMLHQSDTFWSTLKANVVDRQCLKLDDKLEESFAHQFRNDFTWKIPEDRRNSLGDGDATDRASLQVNYVTSPLISVVSDSFSITDDIDFNFITAPQMLVE